MPFLRDVPLVPTVERVVQLTGRTDLGNLEASGELALVDLLRSASNTVHDRLVGRGIQPARVTNPEVCQNAVAWQFLAVLAESGALGEEDPQALVAQADRYFEDAFRVLDVGGAPPPDGLPEVANPTDVPFASLFGGEA